MNDNNIFINGNFIDDIWVTNILKNFSLHLEEPPFGYVLGGQPGAGKSLLGKEILNHHNKNCFLINGDEYRSFHPDYKKFQNDNIYDSSGQTQKFINHLIEEFIKKSKNGRFNFIVEGTFRNPKIPIKTLTELNKVGYITSAFIMTAPKNLSWQSCLNRYTSCKENFPGTERYTKKESHDEAVEKLPDSIETVLRSGQADFMKVFIRNSDNRYARIFDSRINSRFDKEELRDFIQNSVIPKYLNNSFKENISLGYMSIPDELVQKKLLALQEFKKSLHI